MEIIIAPNGHGRCVFSEDIDLTTLGKLTVRRGSHVEPTRDAQWTADMSPVNGPVLGPFRQRSEAIAAERDWLAANWLQTDRGPEPSPKSPLVGQPSRTLQKSA